MKRAQGIEQGVTGEPVALFLGLHGWGANGADLAALGTYLQLPQVIKVFPDAPWPHPQVLGGQMWYGFPEGYDFQSAPEVEGQSDLVYSRQWLRDWILATAAHYGMPLERVMVAGFSQGGAMALDVALSLPVGAVLALSGYLHREPQPHDPPAPVLVVHGQYDPVVPLGAAHQVRDRLQALGVPLTYREYPMGHEISPKVLEAIQTFCHQVCQDLAPL